MKIASVVVALCALVAMTTGIGYDDDYGYSGYPMAAFPSYRYSSYSYLPYRNIGSGSYGNPYGFLGNAYGLYGSSYGSYGDSYSPYGNSYGSRPSYNNYRFGGYGHSHRLSPYNVRKYW